MPGEAGKLYYVSLQAYVTNKFELLEEARSIGFYEHYHLRPTKSVQDTLVRRQLYHRNNGGESDNASLRRMIGQTASLRIAFGWSFESAKHFSDMMNECLEEVSKDHISGMNGLVSDITCDWFGFKPYNTFEQVAYENLSTQGLIIFNNELIRYQIAVLNFIQSHPLYLGHAMTRDESYRFDYFKAIRKDPDKLLDSFHYIVSTINNISGMPSIPRSFIEEMIGCHYLHHPDVFFEAVNFYLLSGKLYD